MASEQGHDGDSGTEGGGGVSSLRSRFELLSTSTGGGSRPALGGGGGALRRGAAAVGIEANTVGSPGVKVESTAPSWGGLRPPVQRKRSKSGPTQASENDESPPRRGLRAALSDIDLKGSSTPSPAPAPARDPSAPPPRPSPRQRVDVAPQPQAQPQSTRLPSPSPALPPPIPPLATRPLASPLTPHPSLRRAPPPAPASRRPHSIATPLPSPEPPKIKSNTEDEPLEPPRSVRSLASRFASPSPLQSPLLKSAPQTPPVTPPEVENGSSRTWNGGGTHEQSPERSDGVNEANPFDSHPFEDTLSDPPRRDSEPNRLPPVPPRPVTRKSTIAITSDARPRPPPRLPSRSATASLGAASLPLPPHEPWASNERETILDRSALSSSPPTTFSPPPPPFRPKTSTSPAPPARIPPKITAPRPSAAAPPLAPRPSLPPTVASAPPSSAPVAYIPPPPPSRNIAANERLAPQRPALPATSGAEDSSEDDDDDGGFSKSQESPDATFANRRPPALRNRKPIHAPGVFHSLAVRGKRVVTAGQHHVYVWHPSHFSGQAQSIPLPVGDHKVPAIEFRAADQDAAGDDGRYVWGGTREGHVFEVDTVELRVSSLREKMHSSPVVAVFRVGRSMITLDDSGKLFIWGTLEGPEAARLSSTSPPKVQRVPEKQNFYGLVGTEIWTSSGPLTKPGAPAALARSPQIRVFDPTGRGPFTAVTKTLTLPDSAGHVGSVTASAIVPEHPDLAYLGHDNGYVSVWNRATYTCVAVQRVSTYGITTMVGVGKCLWAGFRTGYIFVYDVQADPWTVTKAWRAHTEGVTKILVDSTSLWTDGALQIASAGSDMIVQIWDGLLRDDWLDTELNLRQPEFCTYRTVRALCISWNIDASRPDDLTGAIANYEFLNECLTSAESPDIISFGFQEMIDLESKKLTAKTLILGKKKAEQKFTDTVSSSYRLWHDKLVHAVRLAMPPECPYTVIHVGDMVGLFSCIFVKSAESATLRDVAMINVKTGMSGRYGNKGGILSRFVIDDTSLCFINCHLAAGQSHRRQRDHDLVQILEDKSAFSELASSSPGAYQSGGGGTSVFDHELVVLSGDLNYRIDMRREVVQKAVADGALATLLPQDQLLKGLATNPTFRLRSFKEAPITFAPTYKYDPGTDDYDSSAKKRIPAWCDRVLWRSDRADKVTPVHYRRYECNVSDHKPISAALDLRVKSIVPDKRAIVWTEVESAWFGVESQLLESAREFYGGS